jgi:hypothetical protein
MTQFQKIAIGLLGLKNPEMFVSRPKPSETPTTKIEPHHGGGSREWVGAREGRLARALRAFRFMIAALAAVRAERSR